MEQLIIAAAVSFGAGAFGYVVYRFFFVPVLHFRHIRKRIAAAIAAYSVKTEQQTELRKLAAELSDCHDLEVPVWYRLSLQKQGIHPLDAATDLQTLANTKQAGHIERRVAAIRKALGIPANAPPHSA